MAIKRVLSTGLAQHRFCMAIFGRKKFILLDACSTKRPQNDGTSFNSILAPGRSNIYIEFTSRTTVNGVHFTVPTITI